MYSVHPVQVPRWPSNFAPGPKIKFKDSSREIKKKFIRSVDFSPLT